MTMSHDFGGSHREAYQQKIKRSPHVEKKMRQLRNQMDLVEILANFWPFGNMGQRLERLEKEFQALCKSQSSHYAL